MVDIFTKQRKVLNAFDTAALPSSGMNVEYAKLKSNTVQYEELEAEGDKLALKSSWLRLPCKNTWWIYRTF